MEKGKACVLCNGCPENRVDSARVQKYLEENGWLITEDHANADLILFNACSLTQENTAISLKIIQKIQEEKKSGSQSIVWGCLPKIDPEALREKYDGPTFGERELSLLDQIIDASRPIEAITANYVLPKHPIDESLGEGILMRFEGPPLIRFLKGLVVKWDSYLNSKFDLFTQGNSSVFHIKVATGCLGACSYCGIRKSRGTVRSKSITKVMCEFKEGLQKGFKYFFLIGTDLGAYGRDLGYTLVDLLKEMIKEKGDFKIGLRNVNPYHLKKMLNELIPIFKSKKIWYFSSAAESGSNRVLKLMRRNYTIEEFKECIQTIRRAFPDIIIRTQLMAGFPTETEQDFAETMHLLDDIVFDYAEVYRFSKRPGTPAENMKSQVPEKIKRQRFLKLYAKALLNRTPRSIKRILEHHIRL